MHLSHRVDTRIDDTARVRLRYRIIDVHDEERLWQTPEGYLVFLRGTLETNDMNTSRGHLFNTAQKGKDNVTEHVLDS